MIQIRWNFQGQVAGAPPLAVTDTLDLTAFDKVNVDIPDGAKDYPVEVKPGVPDTILLLVIKPDKPDQKLEFKVDDAAAPAMQLSHSQIFSGAAGLLTHNPIEKLLFSNATGAPVNIDIAVGREAVLAPATGGTTGSGTTGSGTTGSGTTGSGDPDAKVFQLSNLTKSSPEINISQNEVPAEIQVDAKTSTEVARWIGAGVQIYEWNAGQWQPVDALANLYDYQTETQRGMHFFTDGPTWQSVDGSRVHKSGEAKKVQTSESGHDPKTDIDWLQVPVAQEDPASGGLAGVTIVQRVLTRGGQKPQIAPAAGSTQLAHIPYTALYIFWKTNSG